MSDAIELFHYADFDRSAKIRWLLCELGLPFEERPIDPEHRFEPTFTDVSPYSLAPAIRRGDETIHDAGAIALTLAGEHPDSGLLPTAPREHAACLQWCWFAGSTLEPAVFSLSGLREAAPDAEATHGADERLTRFTGILATHLSNRASLLEGFTVADILLAYPLKAMEGNGRLEGHPSLSTYLAGLKERPASIRARFWAAPPGA